MGWLMWAGFAFLAVSGWVRAWQALAIHTWLDQAGISSTYLAISGASWGVAGLAVLAWMGLGRRRQGSAAFLGALFFAVTFWADRLGLGRAFGLEVNAPFAAGATILGLAFVFWMTWPIDEWRRAPGREEQADGEKRSGS